ncbi:MAG TPA: hypothetical protein VMI53_06565 [Opitutaceae bacterium]|nr:hypothetical protein [Opitutaceae bacterium]
MQGSLPATGAAPLKTVVAYEDAAAGHRAVGLLKELLQVLSDDTELQPVLWRFDLLSDPHWYKMAVIDAAHADMMILSTSGSSRLPDAVSRWLEASAALKNGDGVTVVILRGVKEAWTVSIQDGSITEILPGTKPAPERELFLPFGANAAAASS